jgi:hypothetical protein
VFGLQRHVAIKYPKMSPHGNRRGSNSRSPSSVVSSPSSACSPPSTHSPHGSSCEDKTSTTSEATPTVTWVGRRASIVSSASENDVIQRLASKNLKLAIVSTSSTLVALAYASALNLVLPPASSPGAEYTFYVREIGQIIFLIDMVANTFALTAMSKAWQPSFLKGRRTLLNPFCLWIRRRGVVPVESSVVSSLGGTTSH